MGALVTVLLGLVFSCGSFVGIVTLTLSSLCFSSSFHWFCDKWLKGTGTGCILPRQAGYLVSFGWFVCLLLWGGRVGVCFAVLSFESRTSYMLDKHCTIEQQSQRALGTSHHRSVSLGYPSFKSCPFRKGRGWKKRDKEMN